MADNNNNNNGDDGGFSYPGYDSSGDERSVTSSVAASVDEEMAMDRRPWRRTAANNYVDNEEEGDASTLDDGNGPWIYAEPRDNEDGEYSLAGTAVSSLGVTSYARTVEDQSVMSHSYSMMSSHQQQQQQQQQLERHQEQEEEGCEDSYAQAPSDQALNSADNTGAEASSPSETSRARHSPTCTTSSNRDDGPSVGSSSHTNSLFRGITRLVSDIMSIDETEPTPTSTAGSATATAAATLQALEVKDELRGNGDDQQDYMYGETDTEEEVAEKAEEEDQVPSPSTSVHSLHSRSSADILKSELDAAINQWESTAKLDAADDSSQEENNNKSESLYSSSSSSSYNNKKSKRGRSRIAAGPSSASSGAAATSIRNLSGMLAERSSARLRKASATASKRRAGATASAGGTSSRSGSISHGSGSRSASPSPPVSRSVSPPTQSKYEDYTVPSNLAAAGAAVASSNVNADATNNVLLAAGAPSAATLISATRSAAHTDLNENIKESQEDGHNLYDEYGDEVYDDEASRARRSFMRGEAPSTSTYGSGFLDMPPPPSEAATDGNRSALREEGMGKKKVSFNTIVSMSTGSGDASSKKLQDAHNDVVVHAASANRTGNSSSLVESSKSLDYASILSSVQSSTAPGAYGSETNTDSRINKKIAANGGSTSRFVAEMGRSEDGPMDRAVNRSVNRSVRKKMAAMGINGMNAEVGVAVDDDYHLQGHQGGGSDESFAVRKSRAGRMTTVSGPGARHMGDGPDKYGPHTSSGAKLTAEMGIEDDEEEGNGYYGRPGLDQMGPLMDASSRWMDGGADHLRKDSPAAAVCGFRRTAVLATIVVAVTIGMIALYVPMGPAHILTFGHDSGGRTIGGPSDSTTTDTPEISPDGENGAGANQAEESDAPRQKPGGVVDVANAPGSPGSGPIPGNPIIPGSPINTANSPQLTAGGPQWSSMTRAEAIRNIVEDLSDADLLDDASSPQNRALRWITDEDEAALVETNPPRIKQRYILAVLYFATNGDSWSNKFNWLSKDHECDWNGVGYDKINDAEAEQGVFCSDDKVAVEIFIISNNMSGGLPEELGGLYQVYSVSFWTNEIKGPIPESLGRLSLLNVLGKWDYVWRNFWTKSSFIFLFQPIRCKPCDHLPRSPHFRLLSLHMNTQISVAIYSRAKFLNLLDVFPSSKSYISIRTISSTLSQMSSAGSRSFIP